MTLVDNNVLSALAKIQRLDLLPTVFDTVGTPTAVVDEFHRAETAGYGFVDRVNRIKSHNGGWLDIVSPTSEEVEVAADIRDHALSATDSQCLAIASNRDRRLLTDDRHVGTIGRQHDVDVWDLPLFLRATIRVEAVSTAEELSTVVDNLRERDAYRFSDDDIEQLFDSL